MPRGGLPKGYYPNEDQGIRPRAGRGRPRAGCGPGLYRERDDRMPLFAGVDR